MPMKVSGNPNVFKEAKQRKKGGKVGADQHPFSSAHRVSKAERGG